MSVRKLRNIPYMLHTQHHLPKNNVFYKQQTVQCLSKHIYPNL